MSTTKSNSTTGVTIETGINTIDPTWYIPSETYIKTTIDAKTAETTVELEITDKGSKKYFARPDVKTETDLDNNTITTSYQYNTTHGYLTNEDTEYGVSTMYRKTEYSGYILAGGSYKPQLVTVKQKHKDDNTEFVRKTAFTYNTTKGFPLTKIENYGTSLALTTEYLNYDNFGNLKQARVSGYGVPSLTSNTEYDATNRFVSKQYTSPASAVVSYLYDTWGNVTSETDETNSANQLTTEHIYNSWGRRTSTIFPDDTKINYLTGWSSDYKKRYYTLTMGTGIPWVKQWYDRLGRETGTETVGPKEIDIITTNRYNSKGELDQTIAQQGDITITTDFGYDSRGRIQSESSTTGQNVTYAYGNRTVTTTRNGNEYSKEYDAWGGIVFSDDPTSDVSYTYHSVGQPKTITSGGALFSMDYDAAGNQKQLADPNAGTIYYTYDAAGRLKTQEDAKGNSLSIVYQADGQIDYSTLEGELTNYSYGTSGYDINRLTKVEVGSNWYSYNYDEYGRLMTEKRQIDGFGLVQFDFNYNSDGELEDITYPGNLVVNRTYDAFGNLATVTAGGQTIWELTAATGTVTTTRLGGTLTATRTLNSQGLLTGLKTTKSSTIIRDMGFQFNGATGNLDWRTGMLSHQEKFYYDEVDRLESVTNATGTEIMGIEFKNNGNIDWKTGLGYYQYDNYGPHALSSVDNTAGLIRTTGQKIIYNSFNKAQNLLDTIGNDAYELDIMYGPDQQRWKSILKKNGVVSKTTIFAGDYENVTENGVTKDLYYIAGGDGLAAIYIKQSGQSDKVYYAHTDHLGSIISLTDNAANAVFQATYDAWGQQNVTLNTIGFSRGYTGHEHLPEFDLINMNGRMYDPILGRFLSPDPYVQLPDFSQNYNRYSYCINNPLIYTDLSGEAFGFDDAIFILVMAYFGGVQSNFMHAADNGGNPFNPGDWNWKSPWTYTAIASSAAFGYSQTLEHCEWANDIVTEKRRFLSHLGEGNLNFERYGTWINEGTEHEAFIQLLPSVITDVPLGGVNNIQDIAGTAFMANSFLNVVSIGDLAPKQDFGGFWGHVKYFTGFYDNQGFNYSLDGYATGYAPITGTAPTPGKIKNIGSLWKLTKRGSSAIKYHKTFGTLYKSKSDGLWWTIDRAGHGGSKFKVFNETNKGLKWFKDADEFGNFIFYKHKGNIGNTIPWGQLSTVR